MTPAISQLYGEAVSLEAQALAESTAKKYALYEQTLFFLGNGFEGIPRNSPFRLTLEFGMEVWHVRACENRVPLQGKYFGIQNHTRILHEI